jgi:hypothetical protein
MEQKQEQKEIKYTATVARYTISKVGDLYIPKDVPLLPLTVNKNVTREEYLQKSVDRVDARKYRTLIDDIVSICRVYINSWFEIRYHEYEFNLPFDDRLSFKIMDRAALQLSKEYPFLYFTFGHRDDEQSIIRGPWWIGWALRPKWQERGNYGSQS